VERNSKKLEFTAFIVECTLEQQDRVLMNGELAFPTG
jgi:hypothetical protein